MDEGPRFDLVVLQRGLFSTAKVWFMAAQAVKLLSVGVGLVSMWPTIARFVPFAVFALAVLAEAFSWKSDRMKSLAERTLRLLEVANGLGSPLPHREIADIAAESPSKICDAAASSQEQRYYASGVVPSPIRLLRNLQESAWWTKHLAAGLAALTLACMALLTIISVGFLVTSINVATQITNLNVIARVVTAALMIVVSSGLFRMALGYAALRDRARASEACAGAAETPDVDAFAALRILHEYQIGRASAPLIPDWYYNACAETLNKVWASQQRSERAAGG